jgi:3-isopropylmalate/(R)-2-methylmalate dehydratase large subunit
MDMYARVVKDALARGLTIKKGVTFYIQYGSKSVSEYAKACGHPEVFLQAGVKVIPPGCGPGMSTDKEQITVSAINRNFQGRSGPGKLYLASPLTVAASAFAGKITAWKAK